MFCVCACRRADCYCISKMQILCWSPILYGNINESASILTSNINNISRSWHFNYQLHCQLYYFLKNGLKIMSTITNKWQQSKTSLLIKNNYYQSQLLNYYLALGPKPRLRNNFVHVCRFIDPRSFSFIKLYVWLI